MHRINQINQHFLIEKNNVFFNKVYDTEENSGKLIAETLFSHGCRNIFTLIGGHISPIITSCEKKVLELLIVVQKQHVYLQLMLWDV